MLVILTTVPNFVFKFNDGKVRIMSGINRNVSQLLYHIAWYGRNSALGPSPANRKTPLPLEIVYCIALAVMCLYVHTVLTVEVSVE